MTLIWTEPQNGGFLRLAGELDTFMRGCLGDRQNAFDAYNGASELSDVALIKDGDRAVACGALKRHMDGTAEIKRVYVNPEYRHRGLGRQILEALESRAESCGIDRLLLETNPGFTSAVNLYRAYGFQPTEPFGPYRCMCTLCMAKNIRNP